MIMMYISVLPIAISVRRTNVYEEKSLGIYGSPAEEMEDEGEPSYVGAHLRRQLSFDLWYIFLGFFAIAVAEGSRIQSDPNFTMFNILFEIVSSYGTVGLSLGYKNLDTSFSAQFGVVAKLVIIAMMIRGRHRGLPYELDRAILLPSDNLHAREAEDASARIARRRSSVGTTGNSSAFDAANSELAAPPMNRSKSTERQAQNFLGSLLHPGPKIPDSLRYAHGSNPSDESGITRRNSTATVSRRGRQHDSIDFNSGTASGVVLSSTVEEPPLEGRQNFFLKGV